MDKELEKQLFGETKSADYKIEIIVTNEKTKQKVSGICETKLINNQQINSIKTIQNMVGTMTKSLINSIENV